MNVLGIESSCDETGVAFITAARDGIPQLRAQALYSQVEMHSAYGGVVPELASRDHIRHLVPLVRQVLASAECDMDAIDLVAFTRGPGLAGALLVGAGLACAFAAARGKPALGVHHLEGHLLSAFLSADPPRFPFLALLVSGGHTQLMSVDEVGSYAMLGETIDDAAGEAFDKSAKIMGLPYPGGPALAILAEQGHSRGIELPRPLLHSASLDFSFAGLKTAVLTRWRGLGPSPNKQQRADLACATQAAIVDVLVRKTLRALEQTGLDRLVVAGGVSANRVLRSELSRTCVERGVHVHFPESALCTDNGAMIALAAAMRWQRGLVQPQSSYAFDVKPRWSLSELIRKH